MVNVGKARPSIRKVGVASAKQCLSAKKASKGEVKEHKVDISYDEDERAFNIYLTDEITGPEDYTNVFDTFILAREDETIRVFLVTPGGRLDTTNKIRGLASMTKAKTIAIVGDVASAGTILALSFDEMIVLPNIEFMIHNYSGGAGGKGHEIYSRVDFLQKEMPKIFKDYYDAFLTDEEIADVVSGNDLYLNSEEVQERWDRKMRYQDSLLAQEFELEKQEQIEKAKEFLTEQGFIVKQVDIPTPTTKPKTKVKVPKTHNGTSTC